MDRTRFWQQAALAALRSGALASWKDVDAAVRDAGNVADGLVHKLTCREKDWREAGSAIKRLAGTVVDSNRVLNGNLLADRPSSGKLVVEEAACATVVCAECHEVYTFRVHRDFAGDLAMIRQHLQDRGWQTAEGGWRHARCEGGYTLTSLVLHIGDVLDQVHAWEDNGRTSSEVLVKRIEDVVEVIKRSKQTARFAMSWLRLAVEELQSSKPMLPSTSQAWQARIDYLDPEVEPVHCTQCGRRLRDVGDPPNAYPGGLCAVCGV